MSQREASERLGIGVREFKRLVRSWRAEGDAGLVSRQRGRPSYRRMADDVRERICALLQEKYAGFGATLAAEKLAELDGTRVSAETVRRIQIELGLWRPKKRRSGDGKTDFGRTVERLETALIDALTPQAKGRVERANQTLQDRLVKEMWLSNISSIDQAEAFLPGFMIRYNDRFAVPPGDKAAAHRPWAKTADDLDLVLASREERVLSKSLTFGYGGTKYCVRTQGPGTSMRGGKVVVHRFAGGQLRFSSLIRSAC